MNVTQQRIVTFLAVCFGGYIVFSIATPMYDDPKPLQVVSVMKNTLATVYKECIVLTANGEENLNQNLTFLPKIEPGNDGWQIVDLESRSQLDLDQDCNEAHLLAVTTKDQEFWGQLAIGLNLQEGQKSCVTRDGEKRDDWSCE